MTRQEYMNGKGDRNAAHRKYYAQFVTPEILQRVNSCLGPAIRTSCDTDAAFNDIGLHRWDAIPVPAGTNAALRAVGDYLTAAGWVCITKEAARQIREAADFKAAHFVHVVVK